MTYPPQDPAGGQYGQSQPGAQPPPGGYAPGQAGGESYPTSQLPGQPQSQPGQAPYAQPGYDPAGYPNPYAQYGAPPVPEGKSGSGTTLLVIGVVLLMIIGGVAGYFLLGDDKDQGQLNAGNDSTTSDSAAPEEEEGGGEEPSDGEAPAPSGTHLAVASLGSVTPIPGEDWAPMYGPGEAYGLMNDSEGYLVSHGGDWISYFGVGVFNGALAPYDPTDLTTTATNASVVWLADGFDTVEGYQQGEITYTEVEVDGRPGVLAEWRNAWTSSADTADLYEDTAILVVDVDGVNGFVGVASVSQSAETMYAPAVEALLATDFDAESA
jgi:hypothetical protein